MARPVLTVRNICVRYGDKVAVEVPSLAVYAQEVLGIIGPNVAGKSTLLRVLGFLEASEDGQVVFQGEKVDYRTREWLALHRRTAQVFQEPLLLDMTVFDNVALGLRLRGETQVEDRVMQWLARFGIAPLRDRRARSLSGGEAQRTSLARAFVLDPELLLLDEPFSALDPPTRDALLADLKAILAETHTTTVFVTHDRNEALALSDRVAVVMDGRIAQIDVPERVFSRPAMEGIARFMGMETILSGRVVCGQGGRVTVDIQGWKFDAAGAFSPDAQVRICVRPEHVMLGKCGSASCSEGLTARVVRSILLGPLVRVEIDCGKPIVALIPKPVFDALDLGDDECVRVSFKAESVHLIREPSASGAGMMDIDHA